jgi:hypothetical protein
MEVRIAPIGLMAVPAATLNVVMLLHAWRRPAISHGRIIELTIRLFRPKSRVLGREAEEWGAMRITVVLKVLERRIQRWMVVEDVI